MAIRELKAGEGEQLTFKGIELGEAVRELQQQENEKKDINEEFNARIKLLKKRIFKLAAEMQVEK